MQQTGSKCSKPVGGSLQCINCNNFYIRHGKSSSGRQRYKCKGCNKTFTDEYINKAYIVCNKSITSLLKEGCGIRSMARLLNISATTLLKRILQIANAITKPITALHKTYEVDELCTYYKNKTKLLWVVYAFRKRYQTGSRLCYWQPYKNNIK